MENNSPEVDLRERRDIEDFLSDRKSCVVCGNSAYLWRYGGNKGFIDNVLSGIEEPKTYKFMSCDQIDDNLLLVGGGDGVIRLCSVGEDGKKNRLISEFSKHKNNVEEVRTINRSLFVSSSCDATIRLWKRKDTNDDDDDDENENSKKKTQKIPPLAIMRRHTSCACTISYEPPLNFVVSGSEDRRLVFWNISRAEMMFEIINSHDLAVAGVVTDVSSNTVITSSLDKTVKIFDFRTGKLVSKSNRVDNEYWSICHNNQYILAGDSAGDITVFDKRRNLSESIMKLNRHNGKIYTINYISRNRYISVGRDGRAVIENYFVNDYEEEKKKKNKKYVIRGNSPFFGSCNWTNRFGYLKKKELGRNDELERIRFVIYEQFNCNENYFDVVWWCSTLENSKIIFKGFKLLFL